MKSGCKQDNTGRNSPMKTEIMSETNFIPSTFELVLCVCVGGAAVLGEVNTRVLNVMHGFEETSSPASDWTLYGAQHLT